MTSETTSEETSEETATVVKQLYVVSGLNQSYCFERFLVVYAAGRPPVANQMAKFRSISEIINPLRNEARVFY